MRILAGDIGGTNTRLILAEAADKGRHILAENIYPSAEYSGLAQVIAQFLSENNQTALIDAACFAVAGPVKSGVVSVTNLPWVISEEILKDVLHTNTVNLINDFVAVSYGISELRDEDILFFQKGITVNNRLVNPSAAIIGAGTGLGVSHRVWLNGEYHVLPSEAGHTGFAPENDQQSGLLSWLQKKNTHVSLEMILSGKGLLTIYEYLRDVSALPESVETIEAMKRSDPAQVITGLALTNTDELCQKALDCFIDIYGAAAGNTALYYYPVDELYIAGGIAVKIKDRLQGRRFIDAFSNKGLMSSNMKELTIKLIVQDRVGLYGALAHAHSFIIRDKY